VVEDSVRELQFRPKRRPWPAAADDDDECCGVKESYT